MIDISDTPLLIIFGSCVGIIILSAWQFVIISKIIKIIDKRSALIKGSK